MKLSGCLDTLFVQEFPAFDDRIRACAGAGLEAVEFWLWRDKNLGAIERALDETGVELTLFSSEPRSAIVDPATHAEFIAGLRESAAAAQRLGAANLCILVDDRGVGGPRAARTSPSRAEQRKAVVAALKLAAPIAADAGVTLLVEPLNSKLDHVGYFLDRTPEALDIVAEVDSPAVKLLFDMYHATMMGEDAAEVLSGRASAVGHVHVADAPGRHEPGSGAIDWPGFAATLGRLGYSGKIGLEYWPTGAAAESIRTARAALGGAPTP